MSVEHAQYLGDGVYADFNGFHVELRVNDHNSPVAVALEDSVAVSLVQYLDRKFPGVIEAAQNRSER